MITDAVISRLLRDQSSMCWKCGRDLYQTGFHKHHCCYTRDIRFSRWLDVGENTLLVCPRCDQNHGILSNIETRKKAWKFKIEHGWDMVKWHNEIPYKVKDNFDA